MTLLLQYTLIYSSVLLLVALGGCFSEHGGVINLGLEGTMVMGALGGALVMRSFPNLPAPAMVFAVVLGSVLFGTVYSLLLAIAAINFKADQTLIGTAMNLLGTAAATVFVKALNMRANANNVSSAIQYIDQKKAFTLARIGKFELSVFMVLSVIILILAHLTLYRTKFGLRLMACGEHPQAADSVGINVYRMRTAGVLISGALGGLGGIVYITAGVSEWKFENGVAGFGFLALAVMIFGQWKPYLIASAAVLFGLFRALSNIYSGFRLLENLHLPGTFYNMLPYVISLIILAIFSRNSRAPKAEGIPYDKGMR
ncbi:MAG: ABC transporter permease [Lachnospiraceae bacterium]|nr:ABC transporter permease [Lachnospiraceae bacterium]